MGAMAFDQTMGLQLNGKPNYERGPVIEEIEGLVKIYGDGHVERPLIMPHVAPSLDPSLNVVARDVYVNRATNLWARVYVPKHADDNSCPLLVYFHGGGFCVGSAAWKCYHEFLGQLSSKAQCLIISVSYRLAPENPLPAAYEDGVTALRWVKHHMCRQSSKWWAQKCDFSSTCLGGDSAGANVAYHVSLKLGKLNMVPITVKGLVLIQPFIGGQERSQSEISTVLSHRSPLTLCASDTYWRLALPRGANRDHHWCNPLVGQGLRKMGGLRLRVLVCAAERDILRDRNMEMCLALSEAGSIVEHLMFEGVGHAFQVLDKSQLALIRREEMILGIVSFLRQYE